MQGLGTRRVQNAPTAELHMPLTLTVIWPPHRGDIGVADAILRATPNRKPEKGLNAMQCPVDGTQLMMSDRSGVEIDYCPQCRGMWLDRGELDKIIERSIPAAATASPRPPRSYNQGYEERPRKKKRDSFLSEIFDF